ncbi:YdhK family protein [Paenibacillus wulumuqiensis]|uniref:YdhK family protein n=1 Tax=Paenibacillus wulumuqiensis TaxID=1567107 RepID=UPI0006194828|nr:YdhK family protein [Paenibacillus wulumuqiensis]
MKKSLISAGVVTLLMISGCSSASTEKPADSGSSTPAQSQTEGINDSSMSMNNEGDSGAMHHSGSSEVPAGLQTAQNPEFPVGSKVMMSADHMEGMKGAEATVTAAYDTTAYSVSYTPVTGGDPVKDHKWVIHEELQNAGEPPLKPGTEVVLNADHMQGMKGAQATIDSAEQTTVYIVDYMPTTGGEMVKNHKWVTEDELTAM